MTNNFVSPTAGAVPNIDLDIEDDWNRLRKCYPNAISDFYASGTPCIYKTGPKWPVGSGPWQEIVRAARPIYDHPIRPIWRKTVWAIVAVLDSLGLNWSAIDPLAYANAGDAELICPFVITISVQPRSLGYDAAVAAADSVSEILVVSQIYSTNKQSISFSFSLSFCGIF